MDSVQPLVERMGHRLVVKIEPPDLQVVADVTRLEQILGNLLSNAAKYSPTAADITVSAHQDDEQIFVAVTDTGSGLAKEDLERIFEPFAQVTSMSGGLGIGLTLVRQLVELHDGSIYAESEGLGEGTRFTFTLPRLAIADDDEVAADEEPDTGRPSVLVVDDNEDAADMLSMLLAHKGFDVETRHTGTEALEAARRRRFAVILMDLGLPDIPGYDVARTLRDEGQTDAVMVAVTGFSHDDARARVREAGFDEHVVKPMSVPGLLELLASHKGRWEK